MNSTEDDVMLEGIKMGPEKNGETTGLLGECIKSIGVNLGEISEKNKIEVNKVNTRIKALEEDRPSKIHENIAEILEG